MTRADMAQRINGKRLTISRLARKPANIMLSHIDGDIADETAASAQLSPTFVGINRPLNNLIAKARQGPSTLSMAAVMRNAAISINHQSFAPKGHFMSGISPENLMCYI